MSRGSTTLSARAPLPLVASPDFPEGKGVLKKMQKAKFGKSKSDYSF